jgi:Membrane bound beta barrel domain (DUF5777)
MKKFNSYISCAKLVMLLIAFLWSGQAVYAQEEATEDDGNKPVRAPFESTWIIDNQTVLVPAKKTLEFMIQHRFGTVDNGIKDLWGLYAPGNIRLGLTYTLFGNFGFGAFKGPLSIGIGTTKNNFIQDFNVKYAFLQQTRNGRIPVSVTYYGNVAMETVKPTEDLPNGNTSDRFSYFNQIIISRRFSPKLTIQVAPSVSHYNVVEPEMWNDHFAIAFAGRFKFSAQSSVIVSVDQPLTIHKLYNPQPNVSFGVEISTSAHQFQIFFTNYSALIPQRNNVFNQNDPWDSGFLLGFNITRLWSF